MYLRKQTKRLWREGSDLNGKIASIAGRVVKVNAEWVTAVVLSQRLIHIFFSLDQSHEAVISTVSPYQAPTLNDLRLTAVFPDTWKLRLVQNGGSRPIRRWRSHAVDLVLGMSAPRPLSSLGDLYSWLSRGRRGPVTPRGSPSTSTSRPGRQQPGPTPLCGKSDVLSCRAPFPLPRKKNALFSFFERGAIGRSMISSARKETREPFFISHESSNIYCNDVIIFACRFSACNFRVDKLVLVSKKKIDRNWRNLIKV